MLEFDPATGILTVPWWAAALVAGCVLILCVFAFLRNGVGRTLAGIAGFAVIALGFGLVWNFHDRLMMRDRAEDRRALDARVAELTLRTIAPGSALACLGTSAGDVVEAACEKTLFANPESVAAAVIYADARLTLLGDANDFAARGNDYEQAISTLQRPVEADRFGFYAHALSARPGCSADACDAADLLLQDSSRILANLKDGTFQSHVGRHALTWERPGGPALAGASSTPAAPGVVAGHTAATTSADFPTASSIPPISIMNNEPGMPGQNGMDNEAKPAPKPAPARRTSAKGASRPADPPGAPIPLAPPRPAAANSASGPAAQ
jgi:hypothetical protein